MDPDQSGLKDKAAKAAGVKAEKERVAKEKREREDQERVRRDDVEQEEKVRILDEKNDAIRKEREDSLEWSRIEKEAVSQVERDMKESKRRKLCSNQGADSGSIFVEEEDDDKYFMMGRSAYLEKSEFLGREAAEQGEVRIQNVFHKNKDAENFSDGFLVGAMFFHSGIPAVGKIQAELTKMGLGRTVTPIIKAATEPRNLEIRVWNKSHMYAVKRTMVRRGSEITKAGNRSFRWKDLCSIDFAVMNFTSLPFQWGEKEIVNGVFTALSFLIGGLILIVRSPSMASHQAKFN
jgi:hypothetical protein